MRAKLTVDLGIIKDNYHYLQTITKAKVSAAIKSDSYGLGANNIAPALFNAGCRDFFVAHLGEGIDARKFLPSEDANIYVLHGPTVNSIKEFMEYNLIPTLSNLHQIEIWEKSNLNGKSIIHVDTGMNRFGIDPEDFASLKTLHKGVEYIISHLANDGDPQNPYNKLQLDKFINATANHKIKKCLAASGGVFLGPEYHFDMVRAGAALYGIGSISNPNIKNPVKLTAPIIHLNNCSSEAYIGYSSIAKVDAGSILATIPIGYADGLFRSWGKNNGSMFINGIKVPIMGTLSMDLTVLDVTGINCALGDEVEIIGPNNTPDQIAPLVGTVGYEILTSLKCGRFERNILI
jgi:alanine racemase